jgi:hypothetical protein
MLKMPVVIVVLVAALCVLRFGSETNTVERAYASPAVPTEMVPAVSLPSNEAALQRFHEAVGDDGTDALPGQVEPVLVKSPRPAEQTRGKPIRRR